MEQPSGRVPAPPSLQLVQDFVNSEVPDFGSDELRTPADLESWATARLGLRLGAVGARDHARVLAARAGLRGLLLANNGVPSAQPEPFDQAVTTVTLGVERRGERFALVPRGRGADLLLGHVLAEIVAAQQEGTWSRLKACRMHGCGWAFYDHSRNRSSRWCSARICGSRQAARDYRSRHRGPA